jgi:transcriptional regulator with XRE-family HTH domain
MRGSKKIIGERIKTKRKLKKFTLNELATKLDVDKQYIWNLEMGNINMTLDYLDKVIEKLDCTHEEFFNIN